jgi:hypothetical protein
MNIRDRVMENCSRSDLATVAMSRKQMQLYELPSPWTQPQP